MQTILIYYFSGTGNAKAAAQWVQHFHMAKGDKTTIVSLSEQKQYTSEQANKHNLIYLLFPTHGFNAPPNVLKFLASVSKQQSKTWILMNTRGGTKLGKRLFIPGLNGLALYFPVLMLAAKGHKIARMRSIDLPSNWTSLHPGFGPNAVKSMIKREKHKMEVYLASERQAKNTRNIVLALPFDLLISPLAVPYYLYGRFALAKTFYANHECTQCGKCVRDCPVQAIVMKSNRPYWKLTCESCMQCMSSCPNQAIETAHGITALLWWISVTVLPALAFNWLLLTGKHSIWMSQNEIRITQWILVVIISLPSILFGYRLLHFLLGFKIINKLITFTSLTRYTFWRKYKYPNNE